MRQELEEAIAKIEELPEGSLLYRTAVSVGMLNTGLMTDDLKALVEYIKRTEKMLEAAESIELTDGDTLFGGRNYWKVDSQTPGDDSPNPEYPDALSAFESLQEKA